MRYNVLTSRTFHHRITRCLGVLVGAALGMALVIPSAAQAQTTAPMKPGVMYSPVDDKFMVTPQMDDVPKTSTGGGASFYTEWVAESTSPSDKKTISKPFADNVMATDLVGESGLAGGSSGHGIWKFRVGYHDPANESDNADMKADAEDDIWGATTTYTHGPPAMPDNFSYDSRPGAESHIFTWKHYQDDGTQGYRLRWTSGDPDSRQSEWETGTFTQMGFFSLAADKLKAGETYTFELASIGVSSSNRDDIDSDTNVHGEPAVLMISAEGTTVPTLPEIAALLLAMLLLGSGAYLLRGRKFGGLTQAS